MAPTSASNSGRSEEEASGTQSSNAAASTAASTACSSTITVAVPFSPTPEELLDSGPFYGMFDRDADDDDYDIALQSAWTQLRPSALGSRAASIPGASETFQKVMRQLDGINGEDSAPAPCNGVKKDTASAAGSQCKTCPAVKKAASFSGSDCKSSSSSSSSSSKDSAALAAEAKRRRSVPCMGGGKHVQWTDDAGVADLVSVRLIRPRLQAKAEKEAAPTSALRSILKRLTGVH